MAEGSERSLKMLAAALEKEEKGREFYRQAVDKCANELGKDLFRKLMADEGVHIVRIKELYEGLVSGKSWGKEWKSHKTENQDLQDLIQKRIEQLGPKAQTVGGDIDALNVGIEMELGAVRFYEDQLVKAVDPLERSFVTCMINEERSHFGALTDLKYYFEHPEDWFAEMERHGLDGA